MPAGRDLVRGLPDNCEGCNRGTAMPVLRLRALGLVRRVRMMLIAAGVCMLAAACGSQARSAPTDTDGGTAVSAGGPTANRSATGKYQLVHQPVAEILPTGSGPGFQVRVRMNRRLPSDAQGVRMNILVGRSGSDAPPQRVGSRSRYSYAASIGNDIDGGDPKLEHARAGTSVRISVRIHGQASIMRSVKLKSKADAITAFGALGCGKR
jgi:hypothetical protein